MESRSVFLTVGTTEFDQLIKSTTSSDVREVLRQLGYTSLLLQIGRGQYEPETMELSDQSPAVQFYRFKDSIADDIAAADLVICHAGAGSVLETLGAGKSSLVVINDQLMNNHQEELAKQLQKLHHLYYCTCSTLQQTLQEADFTALQPYTPGNPAKFAAHLDSLLQLSPAFNQWLVFLCHFSWISLLGLVYVWTPSGAMLLLLAVVCVAGFVLCATPREVQ